MLSRAGVGRSERVLTEYRPLIANSPGSDAVLELSTAEDVDPNVWTGLTAGALYPTKRTGPATDTFLTEASTHWSSGTTDTSTTDMANNQYRDPVPHYTDDLSPDSNASQTLPGNDNVQNSPNLNVQELLQALGAFYIGQAPSSSASQRTDRLQRTLQGWMSKNGYFEGPNVTDFLRIWSRPWSGNGAAKKSIAISEKQVVGLGRGWRYCWPQRTGLFPWQGSKERIQFATSAPIPGRHIPNEREPEVWYNGDINAIFVTEDTVSGAPTFYAAFSVTETPGLRLQPTEGVVVCMYDKGATFQIRVADKRHLVHGE
ncbi:MAG: hypothetical protein BJ554DRAFT_2951 [Olpidium bornovanus]|uniref:Uncharacterized protein n=1 Tax=Olpidium bornovanus TaxID=278681 RepID=A0A8H7ZPZ2_9FUNG|nr:MAG: hypothetical protein BJ554DRAFT_2951 [Olpidium bornovanus]